jgi:hypothetical protein
MAGDAPNRRKSSNAFHDQPDPSSDKRAVSVFVEEKLLEIGGSAAAVIEGHPDFGVLAVRAAVVRNLGLGVTWEPNDQSFSEAHAHINGKKTGSVQRHLVEAAEYREWPDEHE